MMKRGPLFLLLVLLVFLAYAYEKRQGDPSPATEDLVAKVTRVIDGDTFDLAGGTRIRLQGISAPERNEEGGSAATDAMRGLVEGRDLRCEDSGERSHERVVARCFLEEEDVGGWLVAQGLARDCPRHSGGYYAPMETAASRSLPLPGYCRER